jgi:CDGSH-type Zn-finger protein/uncharacterized Fe-S cluster protein YjdI
MSNETTKFSGKEVNVEWDSRLCIHIAECGKSEGELFTAGRKPWCQPDLVSVDDVIDIVKRCPTGALSFESKNSSIKELVETENTVAVSYNGPYFVRGDLGIEGAPADMQGVAFRVALCRCGASKNKPFCDNSHEKINFKDSGAIGDRGEPLTTLTGKLSITPAENGPLILSGNISLLNGSGRVGWTGQKVALCRCGASNNKPFCDGSHVAAGFKSDE